MKLIRSIVAAVILSVFSIVPAFAQGIGQLGAGQVWGNPAAVQGRAQAASISAMLDRALGSTRGAILERGASGWALIGPGPTAGLPFVSNGSGADPAYNVLGIAGGGTNCAAAAAACLDNITGFSSLGILDRAAAGTYAFLAAPSGAIVGTSDTQTLTNKTINCNNNTCTVPFASLPSGSLDQIIGYFGAITANPIAINNCSNALTYSTATHTFGCNSSAGTGTVTSVALASSYGLNISGSPVTSSGTISAPVSLTTAGNSLSADVAIPNGSYADGPSMAQGTTGTWLATGYVTISNPSGATIDSCKLWDGTTIIASSEATITSAGFPQNIALSGILSSPASNIRISCSGNGTGSSMKFNGSGNSKDSAIFGIRIQ